MPLPTEEMGAPVVAAQRYLKVLGYLDGVVDGIAGPGTVAAASRFQADAGLPADGHIDEALVDALVAAAHKTLETTEEESADAVD
jgi:peptidoglycan hydrolase-like protein with peptidoglycan-binding domain